MKNIRFSIAKSDADFAGLQKLCTQVFGEEEVDKLLYDLFYQSPKREQNVCFYAYDEDAEKYVGIVCYLPSSLRIGSVKLKTAEYGIAGTDSRYRKMGINTRLSQMFFDHCRKMGVNIAYLEGIPYFYRQYGFNYAVPMQVERLRLKNQGFTMLESLIIRQAQPADIGFIAKNHQISARTPDICKTKEESVIEAQITSYSNSTSKKDYYLVLENEQPIGYFALNTNENLFELSDVADHLSFDVYESIIAYLQEVDIAQNKSRDLLITDLPESNKINSFLRQRGSDRVGNYAWQVRILDDLQLFQDLRPVLEARIQNSIYRDEKVQFDYNNFRKIIRITLDHGKISFAETDKWEPKWDFNMSPQGAVKLFLGHNSMAEISAFLPDCMVSAKYKEIVNILFPKQEVHFYMDY